MQSHGDIPIADVGELIERLRRHPNVLGVIQYGSGAAPGGADTDLCVVVREKPDGLESVHFYLAGGPVDMNLRTPAELARGGMAGLPGLDEALREGQVLYEREPGLLGGLPAEQPSVTPTQAEAAFMRHGHAHVLTKLDHYKQSDPVLCNVLLCGAVHWLVRAYCTVRGLPYRGEKPTLKAVREHDGHLLADLETACGAGPVHERIEALRRLTEAILAPVGGPWRPGEVLFFAEPDKRPQSQSAWEAFFADLLRAP